MTFNFPYQLPDHEDLYEEQWFAKLLDLLKAEVTDQQYVVGIVSVCVYCTVHPHEIRAIRITEMLEFMNCVYNSKTEGCYCM